MTKNSSTWLFDDIREQISKKSPSLISFDVFDTVITRTVGDPEAVFLKIGQRLFNEGLIKVEPFIFQRLRLEAERRARHNYRGIEVSLEQIYGEFVFSSALEDKLQIFVDTEETVEKESILPIPGMVKFVQEIREKYGRVIYISDMYLSHKFVSSILREHGLLTSTDTLYISSSQKCWKPNGELFLEVLEKEQKMPSELFHIGNSYKADVAPSKNLGTHSYYFSAGNPNKSETTLNNHYPETAGVTALLSGSSKKTRFSFQGTDLDQKVAWNTAASVTGPIVLMFALWVLETAKRNSLKKLYFLARDGHLPYLATKKLLATNSYPGIEAHYLYGSRPTYYALSITTLDETEWSKLVIHGGHSYDCIEEIRTALMAKECTFENFLDKNKFPKNNWTKRLSGVELAEIKDKILHSKDFNEAVLADIKDTQATMHEYFTLEGFDKNAGMAFVDVGWTTNSHVPFYNFLISQGYENFRMMYFAQTNKKPKIPLPNIEAFIFNKALEKGPCNEGIFYPRAVETLLLTKFGRTEGFHKTAEGIKPIFCAIENADFLDKYYDSYLGGFNDFLENAIASIPTDISHLDFKGPTENIVTRFWKTPSLEEARFWSTLSWEWDPRGNVIHQLARKYQLADMFAAFKQSRLPEPYEQFWIGAAQTLSSSHTLRCINFTVRLRRRLSKIVNLLLPKKLKQKINRTFRKSPE